MPLSETDVSAQTVVGEPPNALHSVSPNEASWSSINLAEAVPGVMTPLCASAWIPASEIGLRMPFYAMGVLARRRRHIPADPAERITNVFYGRMAVRVDFLCDIGDLIPGQSGEALSRDFFGFVPPTFVSRPSMRRLPFIVLRYPRMLARAAKNMERLRAETDVWWTSAIATTPAVSVAEAQDRINAGVERFAEALAQQSLMAAGVIQPVFEQLTALASAAGVDASVLLRGHREHEESVVLQDLWDVSRNRLSLEEFLARHGYHGPGEGELSARSWREDPTPVVRLIEQYRAMGDDRAPGMGHAADAAAREEAEACLLGSVGAIGRVKARLILRLARRFVPLRGVGKVAYLQGVDVVRAAARHIGAELVAQGRLDEADDTFYLTREEITGDLHDDLRARVAERRSLRARYQSLDVPSSWTGQPIATRRKEVSAADASTLSGVGASPGVVVGKARVVFDPSDVDVQDGEILVAHTTDPSWVSLMFLSQALVVDIGGMMSHAAVVARELGIPCVMNVANGTQVLATGDVVRVDGAAGIVEIVERAEGVER
ncbi:Prodigiosin synthesizing transferase PigC [Mycobacterium talmoniae]|uniref:Prodigiosin synthesizing transferase PigC n=1 Tax=Mycobacterium talmoniae TaxID=1858794 RepID=A0A2S8BFN0_9MYCO|nr:Prodigiosin synthesizing transferase PigC [Mycobacterium talmoniae]